MIKKIISRFFIVVFIILISVLIFAYGAGKIIFQGEYTSFKEIVTLTMLETSAAKFIPTLFMSQEEVDVMLVNNTVEYTYRTTDIDKIVVDTSTNENIEDIEVIEVEGSTYKGRMIVVSDPTRVYLSIPTEGLEGPNGGMKVEDMVARDGAIAGINGGGFLDENGVGDGGTPLGYVIKDGVVIFGPKDYADSFVGFDADGKLIIGRMTANEAINSGVVEGLCFQLSGVGALVINDEPVEIVGSGGGVNPRTAIGQRADGTILLLTIDGRQSHSLGATYFDIIDIMLDFGAVNAANLDGGSSSLMVYEGEIISVTASLYGSRKIPTAFLVE